MLRPLIIAGSILALALTILGAVRHDYIYYIEQWQLVLAELDPPLNLMDMSRTPVRVELKARRARLGKAP